MNCPIVCFHTDNRMKLVPAPFSEFFFFFKRFRWYGSKSLYADILFLSIRASKKFSVAICKALIKYTNNGAYTVADWSCAVAQKCGRAL